MNAQRLAGGIALTAGALFVVALGVSLFTAAPVGTPSGWVAVPDLMRGYPPGQGPMGPGMMGFGRSGPASAPIQGAPEVRVEASSFAFTPSEIHLPKDAGVNLTLVNTTSVVHDLTVPGLGIHLAAQPGQSVTIGLRGLASGRYDAFCSVPGHADLGMRAVVIVE